MHELMKGFLVTRDGADDDEPTEFELAQEARIEERLAASSEAVRRVIDDCHGAFGYGIPTVVLSQLGQWYWRTALSPDLNVAGAAQRLAQVLSEIYENGDGFVQTAIATGFLEALPYPHEPDREVVDLLPVALREERQRMET
jgi:hypothetical protein